MSQIAAIRIEAWHRHPASDKVLKVTKAVFTHVAIDETRRPRSLPPAAVI
jgi:acyl-CoA hydrolase